MEQSETGEEEMMERRQFLRMNRPAMKRRMMRILFMLVLMSIAMMTMLPLSAMADDTAVKTVNVTDRSSTVYAGEVTLDGSPQLQYLYSVDITITKIVFDNLKKALEGTAFESIVPSITNETTAVHGFFRYQGSTQQGTQFKAETNYFGGIDENWSSAAAVAGRCFTGTVGQETNSNGPEFDSVLSTKVSSVWELIDNELVRVNTITFHNEHTTVIYTKVNVTTAPEPEPAPGPAPGTGYRVTVYPGPNGAPGSHGAADVSQTYAAPGTTITVTVTPDSGYQLSSIYWTADRGTTRNDITDAKCFVMPAADVEVHVSFEAVPEDNGGGGGGGDWGGGYYVAPRQAYRLILKQPIEHGSAVLAVSNGKTTTEMGVYANSRVEVYTTPDDGYMLDKIIWSTLDGTSSYDITEAKSFAMPAMNVKVTVTFRPIAG